MAGANARGPKRVLYCSPSPAELNGLMDALALHAECEVRSEAGSRRLTYQGTELAWLPAFTIDAALEVLEEQYVNLLIIDLRSLDGSSADDRRRTETWRPLTASPVPTHTVSGRLGSTAMQPIEYERSWSKIGVHVVPALMVFHTPPEPTATYQVDGRCGCTTRSAIRPPIRAGPMLRKPSPPRARVTGDGSLLM